MSRTTKDNKKILITGASGFVGSAIFSELDKESDLEIYGISRTAPTEINRKLAKSGKFLQADITETFFLSNLEDLKKIDLVIHCAGLAHQFGKVSLDTFRKINCVGTENILEQSLIRGMKQFILISSVAVYGNKNHPVSEEDFCDPQSFYAFSKLEAEQIAINFCRQNQIELIIIRLTTVIGEDDRGNTMRLITAIDKGWFFWIGKGQNKKSMIYRKDVARAILKVVRDFDKIFEDRISPQIYNLSGEIISMKEIVKAISESLDRRITSFSLPETILNGAFYLNSKTFKLNKLRKVQETLKKWLSDDIYPSQKFNKEFDFEPETSTREAISRQVTAYLKNKATRE